MPGSLPQMRAGEIGTRQVAPIDLATVSVTGTHRSACGFLLSYAWLVHHESDLGIAKVHGLLSKQMGWTDWVEFLDAFLDSIDLETMDDVNGRYTYGELRLSRLDAIYKFMPPEYSLRNLVRGYGAGSTWWQVFFGRNFKSMLAVFAVLSVALSALQVGLATSRLQGNEPFQRASFEFAITSLIFLVVNVAIILLVWLALFAYHFLSAWHTDRMVALKRRAATSSSSP